MKVPGSEEAIAQANAVVEEVTRDGQRGISTTYLNGGSVIRMMVISYPTGNDTLATCGRH